MQHNGLTDGSRDIFSNWHLIVPAHPSPQIWHKTKLFSHPCLQPFKVLAGESVRRVECVEWTPHQPRRVQLSSSVCSSKEEVLRLAPTNHHLSPAPPLHHAPCSGALQWPLRSNCGDMVAGIPGTDARECCVSSLHLFFIWLLLWNSASPLCLWLN